MELFSIVNDFGGDSKNLNEAQLKQEILANRSITKSCLDVGVTGDKVKILFDAKITTLEKATLLTIIASHRPIADVTVSYAYLNPNTNLVERQIGSTVQTYMAAQPTEIHISASGQSQYPSIKAAILANNYPNTIYIVYPGEYYEDNPLILPIKSILRGAGTAQSTIIICNNPTANGINLGRTAAVDRISIVGARQATGIYLDATQSGGKGRLNYISQCVVIDCNIGVEVDGLNLPAPGIVDTLYCDKIFVRTSTQICQRGFSAVRGGAMTLINCTFIGTAPSQTIPLGFPFSYGISCTGVKSRILLGTVASWFNRVGIYVDDNGYVLAMLTLINYNDIAIQIGPNGTKSTIEGSNLDSRFSSSYDLDIKAIEANVNFSSGSFDETKVRNPNQVQLNVHYNTKQFGRYQQNFVGEVSFGTVTEPTKIIIGEGQYATSGIYVFTNTHLEEGLWTDVTYESQTIEAPTFTIFAGTSVGNCFYMGSDRVIPGFKIEVVTNTTSQLSLNDLAFEYWNGIDWIRFEVMQTYDQYPCHTTTAAFFCLLGKFHLRFGLTSKAPLVAKMINGQLKKWVRMRLLTAIENCPSAEYLKLHTNCKIINNDGFAEHFGDSRPVNTNISNMEIHYPSSSIVGDKELFVNPKISILRTNNVYAHGQKIRLGLRSLLPRKMDNSFPMKIEMAFVGCKSLDNLNISGDVHWKLRYAVTSEDSPVYTDINDVPVDAQEHKEVVVITRLSNSNRDTRSKFIVPLSSIDVNPISGNNIILWASIERDATVDNPQDTYDGDIAISLLKCSYVSWNDGSHLLGF